MKRKLKLIAVPTIYIIAICIFGISMFLIQTIVNKNRFKADEEMEYVDKDGTKKRPYIIHRTSIGCYERTLAFLIEKYAGAFPTWLSPVQVKVMNIADAHLDYAKKVLDTLKANGIRAELDDRNEKIGWLTCVYDINVVFYGGRSSAVCAAEEWE